METQPRVNAEATGKGTGGSHRDPSSKPSRPILLLLALILALILLGAGAYYLLSTDREPNQGQGKPATGSTSSTSPTPTTSETPSPSQGSDSPDAEVTTPADLPEVAAASPRKLTLDGVQIGFDESLTGQTDHLIPRTSNELSRWDARGRPSHPSQSSVVIVGKAKPGAAFADLDQTKPGDQVEIKTDTGLFVYTVTRVGRIQVRGEVDNPELADAPGRLLLVGSQYDSTGNRTDEDILVVGQLTGVTPH